MIQYPQAYSEHTQYIDNYIYSVDASINGFMQFIYLQLHKCNHINHAAILKIIVLLDEESNKGLLNSILSLSYLKNKQIDEQIQHILEDANVKLKQLQSDIQQQERIQQEWQLQQLDNMSLYVQMQHHIRNKFAEFIVQLITPIDSDNLIIKQSNMDSTLEAIGSMGLGVVAAVGMQQLKPGYLGPLIIGKIFTDITFNQKLKSLRQTMKSKLDQQDQVQQQKILKLVDNTAMVSRGIYELLQQLKYINGGIQYQNNTYIDQQPYQLNVDATQYQYPTESKIKIENKQTKQSNDMLIDIPTVQLTPKQYYQLHTVIDDLNNTMIQDSQLQLYLVTLEIRRRIKKLCKQHALVIPIRYIDDMDILFYVLRDQFKQASIDFKQCAISDQYSLYSFQQAISYNTQDSIIHILSINYDYSTLVTNTDRMQQFKQQIINQLLECAQVHGLATRHIQLLSISPGQQNKQIDIKFKAYLNSHNIIFNNDKLQQVFHNQQPILKEYNLLNEVYLHVDDFDMQNTISWISQSVQNRGPQGNTLQYYIANGWKGYALNVAGKYGLNDNWLECNNNPEEWYTMFQSIHQQKQFNTQRCSRSDKVIGQGVYCSNKIDNLMQNPTVIGKYKYYMIIQTRVNPISIRMVKDQSNLFIVNQSRDVRPYRVLIKSEYII